MLNVRSWKFCFVFYFILSLKVLSQVSVINGIINKYLPIDSVVIPNIAYYSSSAQISDFNSGDVVMLIQLTGTILNTTGQYRGNLNQGSVMSENNCGNYEFLEISSIDKINRKIFFTKNFKQNYSKGEKFQLVKVYIADKVVINDTVKAKNWDGQTGGVVALFVFDTLFLNGVIDVVGKGFRGAIPFDNYSGNCRPYPDTVNFTSTELNRGGRKGEGCSSLSFPYIYGPFFNANGGGGGKGKYGGGGGGSGYDIGGTGGQQIETCGDISEKAMGGMNNKDFYTISKRTKLGGGGGAGVENKTLNKVGTKGGNGGGIVIIIAGKILSNNGKIIADGENVLSMASASAGGGGGGGVIFIDTDLLSGNCLLSAKGGKGGDTYDNRTGAGGGGSGGLIWLSNYFNVNYNINGGSGGFSDWANSGEPGKDGIIKYSNLEIPLNGILFNAIFYDDTVCQGVQPPLIKATKPRGGTGEYSYKWEQSTNKITWSSAQGNGDLLQFQPSFLNQTTYFRRIVTSGDVCDTSRPIEIFVYPEIKNNIISGTDTICFNELAMPVTGLNSTGGNGYYTYIWQKSNDNVNFINATLPNVQNISYEPGRLQQTTYIRRLVTSTKYCSSLSNVITITVLPKISNNVISSIDTVICSGLSAYIKASKPVNGDGTFSYLWQKKVTSVWENIPNSNVQNLFTESLNNDVYFRRIVFSGSDKACKDTTDPYKVIVLPPIKNNVISTDSLKYCYGDKPEIIKGSLPEGGSGSYSYKWVKKINNNVNVLSINTKDFIDTSKLFSNLSYNRIVYSGQFNACIDTSNTINITVIPYINNKLNLENQSICEGVTPIPFNCSPASGGNGIFSYTWLKRTKDKDWLIADGVANLYNYAPPALYEPTYFVRKVKSDICTSISDTIFIDVIEKIKNNIIYNTDGKVYKCYNTLADVYASNPLGGRNNDFAYKWLLSSDQINWTDDQNNSAKNYNGVFKNNMYIKRVVFSTSIRKECSDTSNIVNIIIKPLPVGDIFSKVDTACANDTLTVNFYVNNGNPPYQIVVGNNDYNFTKVVNNQTSNDFIKFTLNSSQIIKMISIKDDSGCFADLSNFQNIAKFQIYKVPTPKIIGDTEVCGNTTILRANRSVDTSRILWSGQGIQFNSNVASSTNIIANNYGEHKIYLTETNWNCSSTDSIKIMFYKLPEIVDAGQDQILDFKFRTNLNAKVPDAGYGVWKIIEGSGYINDSLNPSTYIYGLDFKNKLVWTVINGVCPLLSDTVMILVNPLKISKVLTPNNDNINDEFKIEIDNLEKAHLIVFNTRGEIVYETENFGNENSWNGINIKNQRLPSGTYFYVLKLKVKDKSDSFIYKGFIELIQ